MRRFVAASLALLIAVLPFLARGAVTDVPKGNPRQPYLVAADEVQFDQDLGVVVARGHVDISQGNQVLLADTVTYNQRTDTVTASGHVSLLEPDGNVMFANYIELQDDFKNGFVRDIRILMADRSRIAGNTARRINGTRTEIRRGVYSPCELCKKDPTHPPLWQIRAERIIDDKNTETVEYRDAVMEIDGMPVAWFPYFSHPDPSVKRATGFLAPTFGYGSSLGAFIELPFFWVIGPDKDYTFTPMFTTGAGEVFDNKYRQRFDNGVIDLDGSIGFGTPRVDVNADNENTLSGGVRGHIAGSGEFDLDDDWRATFNIERSSDMTYLLRYRFGAPPDFLTSTASLENFQPNSYGSITALGFQSLWPGVTDRSQPFAAPMLDYMWVTQPPGVGGQLTLAGNALDLLRASGVDQRRLSLGAAWQRSFDGLIGDRFEFAGSVRGDGYYSSGLTNSDGSPATTQDATTGRIFPQAALTWRYPWVRRTAGYTELIEPVVMGAVAPDAGNSSKIPNEDSQAFEFDDTSLFAPNRFTGFDLVDTGQRVDYGLRGGIFSDRGGAVRFVVGQSYAFQTDTEFAPGSGLTTRLSDVVGRVTVTPFDDLNFIYRYRLGHDDLAMRTQEFAAQFGPPTFNLTVSYSDLSAVADYPYLVKREEVGATLAVQLTSRWFFDIQELRDLTQGINLSSGVGLTYRDDCVSVSGSVSQSRIQIGDVKPGIAVLFTVVFRNLGELGVHAASFQ
jgi:LPS-assembly protein